MKFTSAQDELALVRAAQTDTEVFAVLYDRYVQRLYHYCYHRTNNVHDAEDLTAKRFWLRWRHFRVIGVMVTSRPGCSPSPVIRLWITTAARRTSPWKNR